MNLDQIDAIEKGQLVINAAYLCVFLGAFLLGRMMMAEQESLAAHENLTDSRDRKASIPLDKIARPFYLHYLVPVVRGKPFWDARRKYYKRRIVSSGLRDQFSPDEFIAFKLILIIIFPLLCGVLKALDLVDLPAWGILATGLVGWFFPDFVANQLYNERKKQVLRAMPFIVDLLALSTEAGLDFLGAIGKVVEKATPGPLVDEFGQLLKEIKLGASRQEALREMAARLDMMEFNSFVAILISADQMGASIGKILRQQSDQIRVTRILMAEKAGAAAASKVMLPTVIFIVPAVLLMIFGPMAVGFFTGGGPQ